MASGKRPLAAALALQVAEEEEEEDDEEEGQQQNRKRQKTESSDDGSEEEKETSPVKTTNNPPADIPVKVKAKMPDVPLADEYRGGEFFFVRECYAKYYLKVEALLVEEKKQCVTITGTPGIGKSVFYAFFFDRFRKTHADWTIAASTYTKNSEIMEMTVFEPGKIPEVYPRVPQSKLDEIMLRPYKEKVLWLCDGPPKVKLRQMVVFTSPNEWLRVAINNDQTYYMPPWTLEELQLAASVMEFPFTNDEIESRFWNFGGVARNCFKVDPDDIGTAINRLTEPIEEITDSRKLENLLLGKRNSDTHHRFLLYDPKGAGKLYDTAMVSDMVRDKLAERLFHIAKGDTIKVCALLEGIPPAASFRGWIFENYAHSKLQKADQLRTRSLDQSDREEVFKMQPSDEIDVFQGNAISAALLNNGPYHKPKQKNFESIDGFFFPKVDGTVRLTVNEKNKRILLFQMTVSKDHPVRASGIIYLLKNLGLLGRVKANPKRAALVFVRPTDGSKDFKKQSILSGGTHVDNIGAVKGIGQATVDILATYDVKSIAQLEAKVNDFEAGCIPMTDKKHNPVWASAVRFWRNEELYLKDPSNIKMVEGIPQYVYPLT